ncbi:MAG: hypothetical protein CSA20_06225 [Deltaproteobacteria bacterium]|nr:MAG: hypothetical protein CSA20_06225 [Deltaproteobacteria bacterium]
MSVFVKCLKSFLLIGILILTSCTKNVPQEPAANMGAVFQQPIDIVKPAVKDALSRLSFAILREEAEYFEAVHLKPGETVEKNHGEVVGVWLKPRENATLVLIDTMKRPSGIEKQREWEQPLTRQIQKLLEKY